MNYLDINENTIPVRERISVPIEIVKKIFPVKTFLLTTQRSAWHSTITNRYERQAPIFLVKKDAERKAEGLRKKGSSFTIKETPAIVLECDHYTVLIIQINTKMPFKDYSIFALSENENQIRRKMYGYLNSYLHKGQRSKQPCKHWHTSIRLDHQYHRQVHELRCQVVLQMVHLNNIP